MNIHKATLLLTVITLSIASSAQNNTQTEPTRIRIGETILTLQPPLRVHSAARDSLESTITLFAPKMSSNRAYPRYFEELYIGFGFAVPLRGDTRMPIRSGNSFHLDIGYRYMYRPSKYYAIGTFLQYTCYSYRMKDNASTFMETLPEGDIYKECFRTDNIGTGIIQRLRILRHTQLEVIAYGDWAYSKRYVIKSRVNHHKDKTKYRDDTKFNPFGAGVQAGIRFRGTTLYARYRLTNFFNPDYITPEVTRLSIGINFAL